MLHESKYYCPDCDNGFDESPTRRSFLRTVGTGAAVLLGAGAVPRVALGDTPRAAKPAEEKIRELFSTLSDQQKQQLVYPWDHAGENGLPSRFMTYNSPPQGKRIRDHYTKAQQDLLREALRSILSGDEALERISRNGRWDSSGSFDGCGSVIYGNPGEGPFAWIFAGHHLTLRCDGNSQPGAAFGGPIYYGHSAHGYAETNVYLYQTQQVHEVFDALDEAQRKKAMPQSSHTDGRSALKGQQPVPGIACAELSNDQQQLVQRVMRAVLDPFRPEDADEVMQIVKANGGLQQVHLAFYGDVKDDRQRWSCWRLEGPGFIWNFRVLPHVHCYVNVAQV